jgi:septum formation protein
MPKYILGSSSESRLRLLKQAGFEPDLVIPADIDETPLKREKPLDYIKRIAKAKAEYLHEKYFGNIILCADTIITTKSKIIRKCYTNEEIRENMKIFSGNSIKVVTAVYLINANNNVSEKLIETSIKYKHFNPIDIEDYIKTKQGIGTTGGVCVEGIMESFIIKIVGNYSNIQGLPLYYVRNMLISAGIKVNN